MIQDNTPTLALVPPRVVALYRTYKNWQLYWYILHYTAGVIAVIAGVLATASGAKSGPEFIQTYTWIWGLLAALLSGVVTFLGPLQKAEAYKHAYYILSTAITRFEAGNIQVEVLLNEYERAQSVVLLGDPTAASTKKIPST